MSGERERVHLNGWDQVSQDFSAVPVNGIITIATMRWEGRDFVREADGVWRDSWGRVLTRDMDNNLHVEPPPYQFPSRQQLTAWKNRIIPAHAWLMDGWIPVGQCTCLSGVPASRKSTYVLQLMIAIALGQPYFLGTPIRSGRTLGYFSEDSDDEILRRGAAMLAGYGATLEDLENFTFISLTGKLNTEFVEFTRDGRMLTTPAFEAFRRNVLEFQPILVCLDIVPDFFKGNENDRSQVHQFIRLLDGMALEAGCGILFTAHPSQRGRVDGTLTSGSTGWEGKVRARKTIEDPAISEGDKKPSDRRVIRLVKSNYSRIGEEKACSVANHFFTLDALSDVGNSGQLRSLACMAKFLELLDLFTSTNRTVNASKTQTGAHVLFASHPNNVDHFTKREFYLAMESLLNSTPPRIRIEERNIGGRKKEMLVRV